MRSFAIACLAASTYASQAFLAEPIVADDDDTELSAKFSVTVSTSSQKAVETINWSATAADQTFNCVDSDSTASTETSNLTFTISSDVPAIALNNYASYFATVSSTQADWSYDASSICSDLSFSDEDADVATAFTASQTAFNAAVTQSTVEPYANNGTANNYAYGSSTVVSGNWYSATDAAAWGTTSFPSDFNFLYGSVDSGLDTNVIGLGPVPTGADVTADQQSGSMVYSLFNAKVISNQSVNFQSTDVTLGSVTFDNVNTDGVVAMSGKAAESTADNWTWPQQDATKFTISYNGAEIAIADETKRAASVFVGSGSETLLPLQYYTALLSTWTTDGWVVEDNTGAIYGPTDSCSDLEKALSDLIIRIDDFDFVIPVAQYYSSLDAAKDIDVTTGSTTAQQNVQC